MKTKEREIRKNIADFDYDKIKDMEYDRERGRYIGKDGSEFRVTPYADGTGYKYDYYDSSTYGNAQHNSMYVNSDLNENWSRTDNNRDNGTQDKSSGDLAVGGTKLEQQFFEESKDETSLKLQYYSDSFFGKKFYF